MRILHIINSLGKGGAERQLVDSLPLYKGVSVSLLQLTSRHSEPGYEKQLKEMGVSCVSLGEGHVRSPKILVQLLGFLKNNTEAFDVIHVHLFPALYFTAIACKLLQLKKRHVLVYTEHSTQNRRASKPYLMPMERWVYRQFDAVVAISPAVASRLKNGTVDPNRINLIRNGVPIGRFSMAQAYGHDYFEQEYGLSSKDVKLFMTARFNYPKDQLFLLKSLQYLPENFHLFFVGDGGSKMNFAKQYTEAANLASRVHFLGFRSDVPELMKSADVNILASKYEGMSGVTLEALASGSPFLGSDVPGINDIVPDKRFLFPMEDEKILACKIEKILKSDLLRQQIIKDGLKHVQQFDIAQMQTKYLNLYKSIINNSKKVYGT